MGIVLILMYSVIAFVLDLIFIVGDITNSRKKGVDRSDDIIRICRRILTTTTYMFCGSLMIEWLIRRFSYEDFSLGLVHWL